jgi:multidrug efflux pump subunit AcrA (membrane-fusion protein)
LLAVACLALAACKEDDATPPIRPVLSIKAHVRTTDTLEPFAGSIEPRYATDYSFRQFGRMVARFVDFGSIVKTGDELAVLDPSVQILLVRNAEAAVYSAQAQLATAQAEEERQRPCSHATLLRRRNSTWPCRTGRPRRPISIAPRPRCAAPEMRSPSPR